LTVVLNKLNVPAVHIYRITRPHIKQFQLYITKYYIVHNTRIQRTRSSTDLECS